MSQIWNVARRDFKTYFSSPVAYIVIGLFVAVMGYLFFFNLSHYSMESLRYQMNMGKGISITDGIIRPLYGNMNMIFLMLLPFITMRLMAEEKKQHTIELLMTSPLTLTEIVLGKFLSSLMLVGIMLGLTLVYPIVLQVTGNPDWGPIAAAYIGMFLLCACYLSMGLLFSSMTENQIVAGALVWAVGLFFWLISWAAQSAGPVWGDILNYISLIGHYMSGFNQGILNTSDFVYYFSFIGFMLFLSHRVLDSYRWR